MDKAVVRPIAHLAGSIETGRAIETADRARIQLIPVVIENLTKSPVGEYFRPGIVGRNPLPFAQEFRDYPMDETAMMPTHLPGYHDHGLQNTRLLLHR